MLFREQDIEHSVRPSRHRDVFIETQILDILADVCTKLGHEMPVCRLALQNGEFSIRCYLGRDKPTDHVFGEDWLSDTR